MKPRHPVTVESDLVTAISRMTGLTWDELGDREVIWFLLQGMRPQLRRGPYDGASVRWVCERPCECSRCTRDETRGYLCQYPHTSSRGGSSRTKEAIRQHLRDAHGKVQPVTRIVERIGGPVVRTER